MARKVAPDKVDFEVFLVFGARKSLEHTLVHFVYC